MKRGPCGPLARTGKTPAFSGLFGLLTAGAVAAAAAGGIACGAGVVAAVALVVAHGVLGLW